MCLEKPIFIVGAGRSGSTALAEMLSRHHEVAYLSVLCRDYPARPFLNRLLMKAIDYPLIGPYLNKKARTDECYPFWEHYAPGFAAPCRDLVAEDVTVKAKNALRAVMPEMLTKNRRRFLVKITGWPRIGYLREIFDDAKFIHVVRDGRAVINSFLNVAWWWGWRGPENWRYGELTPSQCEEGGNVS